MIYYKLSGYKTHIKTDNNTQTGWICNAYYGSNNNNISNFCIVIFLSKMSTYNRQQTQQHITTIATEICKDSTRKHKYNPNNATNTYSDQFQKFYDSTIVNELHDLIENDTHWIGWLHYRAKYDLERFLWIYQHQTHTVYKSPYGTNDTDGKVTALQYPQWTYDNNIKNKYCTQVRFIRYDCQRSNCSQRGATKPRKTNKATYSHIKLTVLVISIYKIKIFSSTRY